MPDLVPSWYNDKRAMLSDSQKIATKYFTSRCVDDFHKNYGFMSCPFRFSYNHWLYSHFILKSKTHDKIIEFVRDDAHFPFTWVKEHPKKRKYLVCAEDRQSISVIDLNSWKLHTWLDEDDDFQPKKFYINQSGTILCVFGSVFGDLDYIRFYDFSDPIRFPWKLLGEVRSSFLHENEHHYPGYAIGWEGDDYIRVVSEKEDGDENFLVSEFVVYPDGEYIFDCQEKVEK